MNFPVRVFESHSNHGKLFEWPATEFVITSKLFAFSRTPTMSPGFSIAEGMFITLPFTVLTMGLFIFIINAIIIELTASIVGPFQVDSFGYALLFSLIITALNYLLELPNRWLNRTTYKPRGDKDTDDDGFTEYEEVQ